MFSYVTLQIKDFYLNKQILVLSNSDKFHHSHRKQNLSFTK